MKFGARGILTAAEGSRGPGVSVNSDRAALMVRSAVASALPTGQRLRGAEVAQGWFAVTKARLAITQTMSRHLRPVNTTKVTSGAAFAVQAENLGILGSIAA